MGERSIELSSSAALEMKLKIFQAFRIFENRNMVFHFKRWCVRKRMRILEKEISESKYFLNFHGSWSKNWKYRSQQTEIIEVRMRSFEVLVNRIHYPFTTLRQKEITFFAFPENFLFTFRPPATFFVAQMLNAHF